MNSKNSLDRLVQNGKLKRQKTDSGHLNDLLEAARRNFEAASIVRDAADEAAFKLIYDGLLQICRAVLLLNGFRPDDGEQHKTTFFAAGEILGPEVDETIRKIQKFRIKRNDCVYDPRGLIGKSDFEAIYRTARDFWIFVRSFLKKSGGQLVLFDELPPLC